MCLDSKQDCSALEKTLKKAGYKLGTAGRRYAIIINGDKYPFTVGRHKRNVERAKNHFTAEGFNQVFVLSPGSNAKMKNNLEPSIQNIREAMSQIKSKIRRGDSLVIYTTGHGTIEKNNEAGIVLPSENLSESKMIEILGDLSQYNVAVIMDQCYGGRWVNRIANKNIYFAANTTATETGICEDFNKRLFRNNIPDLNKDGYISIMERIDFAARIQALSGITVSHGKDYIDRGFGVVASKPLYPPRLTEAAGLPDLKQRLEKYHQGITAIFFSAKWCGPCKLLEPKISELAKQYEGKIQFIKVDIDKCKDIAEKYKVNTIPRIIMLQDERELNISGSTHLAHEIELALCGKHPYFKLLVERLIAKYKESSSQKEKERTILAMRRVAYDKIPQVIDLILKDVLTNSEAIVSRAGIDTLVGLSTIDKKTASYIASRLLKLLRKSPNVVSSALEDFGQANPELVVPTLTNILNNGSEELSLKVRAIFILRNIGSSAAAALPALYNLSGHHELGSISLSAIGMIGKDDASASILTKSLVDKKFRGAALSGLRNLMLRTRNPNLFKQTIQPLCSISLNDNINRDNALRLLGHMGDLAAPAIPIITAQLSSNNPNTRSSAAMSLSIMGRSALPAIPKMIALIDDPNENVRININDQLASLAFKFKNNTRAFFVTATRSVKPRIRNYAGLVLELFKYKSLQEASMSSNKEIKKLAVNIGMFECLR